VMVVVEMEEMVVAVVLVEMVEVLVA